MFPVQLNTGRINNLTLFIHTLLYLMTMHTYIHQQLAAVHLRPPQYSDPLSQEMVTSNITIDTASGE